MARYQGERYPEERRQVTNEEREGVVSRAVMKNQALLAERRAGIEGALLVPRITSGTFLNTTEIKTTSASDLNLSDIPTKTVEG